MSKRPVRTPATPAPIGETKAEKFRRLGVKRVTKAVKAINAVKQLSGKGYECTDEQALKVHTAIEAALVEMRLSFENRNAAKAAQAQTVIDL